MINNALVEKTIYISLWVQFITTTNFIGWFEL